MASSQRPNRSSEKRTRKYRPDGTLVSSKGNIDGPGIWVSCVKGREKQTVGELYDLLESIASELWPDETRESEAKGNKELSDEDHSDGDGDVETQIAKELASMKQPRKELRFISRQTNTPCVIFISCKYPIDPVKLVTTHVENVQRTGITHTRYTHRLIPVSGSCVANIPEIHSLCHRVFTPFFSAHLDIKFRYRIELRVRNHTTLARPTIIQEVARCVPDGHIVNLEDPEIFILVEVFKSVCGVSIVRDYYRLLKFNVMEIANAKNLEGDFGAGEGKHSGDSDMIE